MLAIPAVIEGEYRKHRDSEALAVLNKLREHHNTLTAEAVAMKQMLKRCALTEAELPSVGLPTDWVDNVAGRFAALAATVHPMLTVLPHDEDDVTLAYARVVHGRAPAAKGAASMNDSTLCEVALRIAGHRSAGATGLLTSNSSDFRPTGSLDPELVNDYDSVGLVDLPTWRDALRFAQAATP